MLDNDTPFIEASRLILALSKDISDDFEKEIGKRIEELKNRELVRTRSNMEVIMLHGEALIVKLVESGKVEHVDENNEEWIKLGLTKYVRQLARALDVDVLLLDLKKQGVINDTLRRTIEQTYNYEEQMQHLILHMLDETRENLLKFVACLRKKNSLLADLVQHKPSDEKEIDESLKREENMKIKQIIQDAFVEEEKGRVACEDIHIFIENRRKVTTCFQSVLESVRECFPKISFEENDSLFHGIAPKAVTTLFSEDAVVAESSEEVLTEMSSDKFGVYLAKQMEATKEGIGHLFEEMCIEECLSAKIFGQLTDEQLEQLFSPKLQTVGKKYGIGIKCTLSEVQKNIKRQLNRVCSGQKDTLRKFDTPAERVTYTKSTVRAATGNLLTPAHEFIYPFLKKQFSTAFMAKEVIRFALACINGKKNGTIHFGIKEACNGTGEVVGLPRKQITDVAKLNAEIISCIQNCLERKYQLIAERCIRPAQVITVEEDMVVVEIDIVPFSSHVTEELIIIKFPPKGNQRRKCFAYKENMVITIEQSKVKSVRNDFQKLCEERLHLEKDTLMPDNGATSRAEQKLRKLLTGGNKFVTDAFDPVICSGNITGCPNEDIIRQHMSDMSIAFTSSITVFDFDSSVELRDSIEKENNYFQVKIPEDFNTKRLRRESDLAGDNKIWLYSNGNEELGKGIMSTEKWYLNRLDGVQAVLNLTRQQIPAGRGLVIYLVYQKAFEQDPMLEIARETFLKSFKDECIVIVENEEFLQEWRREMKGRLSIQDFENKIVTGLAWDAVASIVKSVFHPSKDVLYKFPDSKGHIVEMTSKEHDTLQLNTIDLVNGFAEEQCRIQEEECDEEKCRQRRLEEQEMFYKGNEVTWWNFYCSHVGKRDKYESHKKEIRDKLHSVGSADRFETYQIEHHPGAGGSTLARHILWHYSQIKHTPDKAYRCCIVNRITEETAEEIHKFKIFKDKSDTKPVIVLVDNKSEEHLNMLKARIDETAYKKGSPGKVFCLLLIVTRVPVSHKSREIVLGHDLTKKEKLWFEEKFKELEMRSDFNVNTLIAFNVMRHSFDVKFIEETIQQLINDITMQELKLLEILSLICSFDSDNPVPETVFDSLMLGVISDPNLLQLQQCLNKPFGIVWSEKERRAMRKVVRETWNVNLTGAMQLFITHRRINSDSHFQIGVCILSQPFSRAIVSHIMASKSKSFENMVDDLLVLLSQHCPETNAMSKHFTRIVCSLFTYREPSAERGDLKAAKFSALVLQLEKQLENESIEQAQNRVVRMMKKCFDISGNAMVGQQLARYHYHLKDYKTAEDVIKRCLSILPQNSYLLDTYGQIFKSKMEHILACKTGLKMNDTEAAEFIELAFKAVEKFKHAQIASTSNEDNTSFNSNSFYMEVVTALYLLENFHKFECFGDKETFWSFLNDTDFVVNGSPYENILILSPVLEQFRNGSETQDHIAKSLRILEEKAYMTRNHLTTVITPSKDMLLLKPRERFELFYGSKEHTLQFEFLFGVGLKLLMRSYQGKETIQILKKRMKEAELRLQWNINTELERDILIYIGYYIIEISNKIIQISREDYRKLLNFSTHLWQIQREKGQRERHYVEAYLYYALLHWLLPCRSEAELDSLSHPDTYKTLLRNWEAVYMENNYIRSKDQLFKEKPKIFFALGKGGPGNDIVDLEWLRTKWRENMLGDKRTRREVKADNHWQHAIFKDSLLRLSGTVDSSGRWISTEVTYNKRSFSFQIRTNENNSHLSNRAVTFVLGFSWMAPVALDVRRAEKTFTRQTSQNSLENEEENLSPRDQTASSDALKQKQGNGCSAGLPQRIKKNSKSKGYQIISESVGTNKTEAAGGKIESGDREKQELQQKTKQNRQCNDIKKHDKHPPCKEKQAVTTQHGRIVTPYSGAMVRTTPSSFTAKDPAFQASSADTSESKEFKGKDGEEWCEVHKKKKAKRVTKEQQGTTPVVSPPLRQAPSSITPKEKFEALISRCQEEYPSKSREKIILAYEKVKQKHRENFKHLGTENIVKEVGQNLK